MLSAREQQSAIEVLLKAAMAGTFLVKALREFEGVSRAELARRTGMPVSRFLGEEEARLSFADDELDSIAAALDVPVDLLLD